MLLSIFVITCIFEIAIELSGQNFLKVASNDDETQKKTTLIMANLSSTQAPTPTVRVADTRFRLHKSLPKRTEQLPQIEQQYEHEQPPLSEMEPDSDEMPTKHINRIPDTGGMGNARGMLMNPGSRSLGAEDDDLDDGDEETTRRVETVDLLIRGGKVAGMTGNPSLLKSIVDAIQSYSSNSTGNPHTLTFTKLASTTRKGWSVAFNET